MSAELIGDPKFRDYLTAQATLNGTSIKEESDKYENQVLLQASGLAFDSLVKGRDLKLDDYYKQRLGFQHDFAMENLKQQNRVALKSLETEAPNPNGGMLFAAFNNGLTNFKPVEFNKDGSVFKVESGNGDIVDIGDPYHMSGNVRERKYKTYATKDILSDPSKAAEMNINYVVLKGVKDANPELDGAPLIDAYNKAVSTTDFTVGHANGFQMPTENQAIAKTKEFLRNPSSYSAVLITPEGEKPVKLSDYISDIRSDDGKLKALVGGAMFPEYGPGGLTIDIPDKGTLVIEPPSDVKRAFQGINGAHKQAAKTGKGYAVPGPIGVGAIVPMTKFSAEDGRLENYYVREGSMNPLRRSEILNPNGSRVFGDDDGYFNTADYQNIITGPILRKQIPAPVIKGSANNMGDD